MSEFPRLHHTPIVEALINFQADASEGWARLGGPEKAQEVFPSHSVVEPINFVNVELTDASSSMFVSGYILSSKEDPMVYQVRRDGFGFSHLKEYPGWERFYEMALRGWQRYSEVFSPEAPVSLQLHYLNRLQFPRSEFRENRDRFLTIAPRDLPNLGWGFVNFVHGYQFRPFDDRPVVVTVEVKRIPPHGLEWTHIQLDISAKLDLTAPLSPTEVSEAFADLRILKNKAFFAALTESSLQEYLEKV